MGFLVTSTDPKMHKVSISRISIFTDTLRSIHERFIYQYTFYLIQLKGSSNGVKLGVNSWVCLEEEEMMMTMVPTPCTRERKMKRVGRLLSWRTILSTNHINFVQTAYPESED